MRGYVQVYTGDGKCKTTAAVGLAVRAVGAGLRVFVGQFAKPRASGEIRMLRERFPEVTVALFGRGGLIRGRPAAADIRAARRGLARLRAALAGGTFDVVIADEANTAVRLGLLTTTDLLALIAARPANVELVLTGRAAGRAVIRRADLVTEMRCVKHYFAAGVAGRAGIEW